MSCENLHDIPFESLKKVSLEVKAAENELVVHKNKRKFCPKPVDYNHGHVPLKRNKACEVRSDRPVAAPHSFLSTCLHSKSTNKVRDPRFSDLSGTYNRDLFIKSYKFIDDLHQNEIKELKAAIELEKDPTRRKELQRQHDKLSASMYHRKRITRESALKKELLDKEREAIAKTGKKPFMPKKSLIKAVVKQEKLEALKKSDKKYKKHLVRQSKKEISKAKKFKPKVRRDNSE